jgi:stage II sporulation protein GA (sporulation sigma-E factor processing peptidase)
VLIGLDGGTLSAEGKYRAIIHPDVTAQEEGSADTNQKRDAHLSEHSTESG